MTGADDGLAAQADVVAVRTATRGDERRPTLQVLGTNPGALTLYTGCGAAGRRARDCTP